MNLANWKLERDADGIAWATLDVADAAANTLGAAVLTELAVYNLERNNHFDCSKAKNELGFAPRPYKETLHDLAVWLKQEGKIA